MKNWKFACSSAPEAPTTAPILLTGDICDNLQKAAKLGYQAIEVHTRETAELDYAKIRATAAACGTKVGMIVTGRLFTEGKVSLMDDIPYVTDSAIKGMLQYIDMAAELDADIIVGWVKGNIPAGGIRKKYLDRLAKNLRSLNDYGKEKNVTLNIEVINRYEVNLFRTCQELSEFLVEYQLDNCFIHLDTFHMNIEETDPYAAIALAGSRLGYFHLADNSRLYPGSGQLDFKKTLEALEAIDYDGYLSIECLPVPTGEEAARLGLAYMKTLI